MRYQPIVCLQTGLVAGVEALSTFPEADGRTTAQWYSDAALAGATTALELAAAGSALALMPKLPGFLSLNVTVETLCAPKFPRLLADQPLEQVVLELSEHDPITDYAPVLAALAPLRARGLRLAVDDAGAGFASLRHVLQLAPDFVKLDLSLVRDVATDPARQALATALLAFAAKIGATVIAEGIEIRQELAMLRELGVALGQGFLISRPLPAHMWDGDVPGALSLPSTEVLAGR
jgi:EAL domain-containing protein (putative c-di-GMP-specific phosphodiesterase class I)